MTEPKQTPAQQLIVGVVSVSFIFGVALYWGYASRSGQGTGLSQREQEIRRLSDEYGVPIEEVAKAYK